MQTTFLLSKSRTLPLRKKQTRTHTILHNRHMNVAVLGASDNPERFSNKAVKLLTEKGHHVIPIHPTLTEIDGIQVHTKLADSPVPIDTISVYLRPNISEPLADEMMAVNPRRVIFNPGTESTVLKETLTQNGIDVVEQCTLVMLRNGVF
eukprot:TRINITY_DN11915_c0_g1_i1.p1 TRINITY_DN11915_c0_g1~~TRINITY_DN11915_c0_g1_i1.p1  ORF type:complete len:159 (-),score=21.75 TRINITY_DN11915_c0_g1_i1:25-474(-)